MFFRSSELIHTHAKTPLFNRSSAAVLGLLLAPSLLSAYSSNPPLGLTRRTRRGHCASCHSPLTSGSGVTIASAGGLTSYTPGGPAIPLTIAVTAGTGGFEVSARTSSGNAQAGTFIAGTNSNLGSSLLSLDRQFSIAKPHGAKLSLKPQKWVSPFRLLVHRWITLIVTAVALYPKT